MDEDNLETGESATIEAPYADDTYPGDDEDEFGDDSDATAHAPLATPVAERLGDLVTYLASNLVDEPASVEVETRQRGGSVFVTLRVPEEELGKVIGRGGRIARAMRTALMISGSRNNVRASLDIED